MFLQLATAVVIQTALKKSLIFISRHLFSYVSRYVSYKIEAVATVAGQFYFDTLNGRKELEFTNYELHVHTKVNHASRDVNVCTHVKRHKYA